LDREKWIGSINIVTVTVDVRINEKKKREYNFQLCFILEKREKNTFGREE